ncbi:MAG: orotidine-5-phosphate decarboxylase [Candidatus Methanomethylophilaceae archaeon]|nr:orotidine-5-phosphate decarboxylase [Candidatus Methanomethylophilaceae archaeon]MDI3541403.1 orotidine-5-phosphate decarboxylase [Candidatus Methanomethylophilaceae archaeon]HIJ00259.1 orotidine-5'-phosphate decarboxylase [Candidatus Methanomethylophilaceae archaeon]
MRCETRLVLALDETSPRQALDIVSQTCEHIDAIKVNWPLILNAGPEFITRLALMSDVICDFKIADIPNTNRLIVERAVNLGASAIIVHAFVGEDSLRACMDAAGGAEVYVVTEMSHPGGKRFTAPHAEEMAAMALGCGAHGIIAPATRPERIASLREMIGKSMKILSPGVGAQGGSAAEAVAAGADYVIVGRAIYQSTDPEASARSIKEEIAAL